MHLWGVHPLLDLYLVSMLLLHLQLLARVLYGLGGAVREGDDEGAGLVHAVEGACTLAYGEGAGLVAPGERDGAVSALLIVEVIALVLIESE